MLHVILINVNCKANNVCILQLLEYEGGECVLSSGAK